MKSVDAATDGWLRLHHPVRIWRLIGCEDGFGLAHARAEVTWVRVGRPRATLALAYSPRCGQIGNLPHNANQVARVPDVINLPHWCESASVYPKWMQPSDLREQEKRAAAERGVQYVENGMAIGLGTGSTSAYAIALLGERIRAGLDIRAVPTSSQTECLAIKEGIRLIGVADVPELDLTIDGADEIDPNLHLIKGGGGALLREKVVASASRRLIIIADSTKPVPVLGAFPLPLVVIPFAAGLVARRIIEMGAAVAIRLDDREKRLVTEDGGYILDCRFDKIPDPASLARELERMPGVVEHGLFVDMADVVLVASDGVVTEHRRDRTVY
jgi:ribose 5-phosphate isomerase A